VTTLLSIVYLAAIVAANLITARFGPAASVLNAFLFIGLNLSARDSLHDRWGKAAPRNVLLLIAVGGLLSYLLNSGAGKIAIASVLAFALSESVDAGVYHVNRRRPYLIRSNASNVFGAAVDSVVFPVIAFGGFPIAIIALQFAAKVLGGLIWSLVLNRHARPIISDEAFMDVPLYEIRTWDREEE